MPVMFRFSTRITSNRRARSVLVFSAQSLRRSTWRALSFAMASLTRARRVEPRLARASLRWRRRTRRCRAGLSPGTLSISPVDSAALTVTPGRRRPPGRCPARGPARGPLRRRHASVRTYPVSPGRTSRLAAPDGTSGIVPTRPSVSAPHPRGATGGAHPIAARASDDPESLVPAGLAPGRPPGRIARVEERGPRVVEVPQGLLLHRLGPRGQPCMLGPCLGELAALFR